MSDQKRVRTRYAPSPTGRQHVGGVRSALYPWLWARHTGGDFLLRIEDTDQSRYRADALRDLLETLDWLGLNYDEGPEGPDAPPNEYFQTRRAARYQEVARRLVEVGAAYYAYESAEELEEARARQQAAGRPTGYDRASRYLSAGERAAAEERLAAAGQKPVVRLAAPEEGTTRWNDLLRGEMEVDNRTLEDLILLKSDGLPTYHLGHVVDDRDMEITHVLRADEYIPTAPLHVLIHRALEWPLPIYVHLPLILDPGGRGKMSKRKQAGEGSGEKMTMVWEFREAGYLPEALLNYIALLGWSVGPDRDIASVPEMVERFELRDINRSPSAFDYEKLEFMNGHYLRQLSIDDLVERVAPFMARAGLEVSPERLRELLPMVQERMKTLAEAPDLLSFFLTEPPAPDPADLPGRKMDDAATRAALAETRRILAACDWTKEAIEEALRQTADRLSLKAGQLFQPLRVAVTSRKVAPGIFDTVYHLGRESVLERLDRALEILDQDSSGTSPA